MALTFVAVLDDPARFCSSETVGPHFGPTPRKCQSGETDMTGHISKIGDAGVPAMLYEGANTILIHPARGLALESWEDKSPSGLPAGRRADFRVTPILGFLSPMDIDRNIQYDTQMISVAGRTRWHGCQTMPGGRVPVAPSPGLNVTQ